MKDLTKKSEDAARAYAEGNYAEAMSLLNEVVEESPNSRAGLESRVLRALAYESGRTPAGQSLDLALADFRVLSNVSEYVGSVGLVGAARTLGKIDVETNAKEIISLCEEARALDNSSEAALVIGDVQALAFRNEDQAREWYRRAISEGESRGYIKISQSFNRQRRRIISTYYALRYLAITFAQRELR